MRLTHSAVLLAALSPFAHATSLPMPQGQPTPLITQAQREAMGLRIGPDSILDVWNDHGQNYLVFSGSENTPHGAEFGSTFRLAVDPDLRQVGTKLEVIMHADCRAEQRPDGGRACTKFDSDYAGAGVTVPCPQTTLYIYHGENHTPPDGQFRQGNAGWTGIGQAHWDPTRHIFVKDGQIAGLSASNVWQDTPAGPQTGQTNAASGNPSVAPDPTGQYLYLYFGDRSPDAADATPYPGNTATTHCERRTCWAVARTNRAGLCAAALTGHPAAWQIWHNGRFDQPALLPNATGSAFTPVLNQVNGVDNLANVTAAPALHGYLMASILRPGGAIVERFSSDGLNWSAPTQLVEPPPPGTKLTYPRILPTPQGGFLLTYVIAGKPAWRDMTLMRQDLR